MIIIVHVKPGLALYPASLLEKEIFVLTVAHCVIHVRLAVHLTMDSSLNIGVKIMVVVKGVIFETCKSSALLTANFSSFLAESTSTSLTWKE